MRKIGSIAWIILQYSQKKKTGKPRIWNKSFLLKISICLRD